MARLLRRPRLPHAAIHRIDNGQYGEGNRQQRQRHAVSCAVFQGLHVIVNVDRDGARYARQISAHHQHHTKFSQGVRETQHRRRHHSGKRQRQDHSPKRSQATRTQHGRSVQQFSIDALKRSDQRLHRKRKAVQHRRQNQAAECERQAVSEECDPQSSQRPARPHHDERVKSEHRWRQYQRQRHQRFEQKFPAPVRIRQPVRHRHTDQEQYRSHARRQLHRQPQGFHWPSFFHSAPRFLCALSVSALSFFLLFSASPETQNHIPRAWRALPHSSQIPGTLAPLPYSSRPSRRSLPVLAPDASPLESPSVFHRAWQAKPPATSPQSPPARFPTAQIAPLAKYFLRTRAWL